MEINKEYEREQPKAYRAKDGKYEIWMTDIKKCVKKKEKQLVATNVDSTLEQNNVKMF